MAKQPEELTVYTLEEAADMLQVSTRTLQRMIQQGRLPALKVGSQWRIRKKQLTEWCEKSESVIARSKRPGDPHV
jgi:excisionase family DNA binding protein